MKRVVSSNPSVLPTVAAIVIFIGMVIYGEVAYGRIVQYNTLSNLLINNAHLIILAVGMTFVILTGGIDLSVGSVIALSSVAGVMLANAGVEPVARDPADGPHRHGVRPGQRHPDPVLQRAAVHRDARHDVPRPRPRGAARAPQPERLDDDSPILWLGEQFKVIDGEKVNDVVVTPGVIIALAGRARRVLRAAPHPHGPHGVRDRRLRELVGAHGPAVAAHEGARCTSSAARSRASPRWSTPSRLGIAQNITGIGWELDAIAATVIGGTLLTGGYGYVLGSVVGALVLGLMNVLITRDGGIPPEMTTIITGGILLVFVLLQRAVTSKRHT